MRPPSGVQLPPGCSMRLRRALYGLHQSPRLWNQEINGTLLYLGFVPSDADPCVYTMTVDARLVATFLLWVDDGLLAADDELSSARTSS